MWVVRGARLTAVHIAMPVGPLATLPPDVGWPILLETTIGVCNDAVDELQRQGR